VSEFRRRMESAIERLLSCSLEDFGLDKSGDFSGAANVGLTNAWKAWTLLRTHEAFIEYIYYAEGLTMESSQVILKIFHLGDDLREGIKKGSGKKKVEPLPSVMTLTCVANLSETLFGDPTASKQQAQEILNEDDSLIKFIVQLALNGIQTVLFSFCFFLFLPLSCFHLILNDLR
jgi:hypothetical protein